MEASENIPPRDPGQLAFEPASGSVRALGDRLVIESLTVTDETAARVVRERAESGQQPPEAVAKMVEIGARVLDREETAADVDYVRREVESGLGELDRKLENTLENGTEAITEEIAKAFGAERNDSVQAQIREIVGTESRQLRESLISSLTAEDGSNPLVAMQARIAKASREAEERHRAELELLRESHGKESRGMRAEVAGLKEQIARLLEREDADERVAEAEERGTAKGRTFEEAVHAAIEQIADGRGDVAAHTGDTKGDGGTKLGDTVVEIGAAGGRCQGRIVFEVKRGARLSKNEAWAQLNGALKERDADFAVLVVAGEDKVPAKAQDLTEYEGNKLIVAVDQDEPESLTLSLAYRYARLRAGLAASAADDFDTAAVQHAAEAAGAALKRVQKVRLALSNIENQTGVARDGLNEVVADVEAELKRIEGLVADA